MLTHNILKMKFLKQKFNDQSGLIDQFLLPGNVLKKLENQIPKDLARKFVNQFLEKMENEGIFNREIRDAVSDQNPWSVDFPSWYGPFDENAGKRFFIIGAEPHIHFEYIQSVYQLNGEAGTTPRHEIFDFLVSLLGDKDDCDKVLSDIYMTDLFPLAPKRGNGKHVGSTARLEELLKGVGSWHGLRRKYAKSNLAQEIEAVRPELVITQGKVVFDEVVFALSIESPATSFRIESRTKGVQNQSSRMVKWKNCKIISIPHVGTMRHRAFYRNQVGDVSRVLNNVLAEKV